MAALVLLLTALQGLPGGPGPAQAGPTDPAPPLVRVRWLEPPQSVAFEEPFELRLAIELSDEALGGALLPLLNRPLDLPLAVGGAWFAAPEGLEGLAPAPPPAEGPGGGALAPTGPTVVLGDRVGSLWPVTGSGGAAFEVRALVRPTLAGTLELPPPTVRFATATRFELDWLGRRRAVDRDERFARAEGLAIEVRPWPEGGRPPAFVGAVGDFELSARAEPRDLELGEELEVVLTFTGRGGVALFAPPDRLDLEGFVDLGRREVDPVQGGAEVRVSIAYRLRAERPGAIDLAPEPWSWLAPGGERFVRARLEPMPIVVRGELDPEVSDGTGLDPGPSEPDPAGSATDAVGWRGSLERFRSWGLGAQDLVGWALGGLAALALAWLAVRAWRAAWRASRRPPRRERDDGLDHLGAGCRAAAEADDLEALETGWRAFLARRTGLAERSLTGADAFPALTGRGLDAATARAAADQLDRLGRARFGGAPVAIDGEAIDRLVAALTDPDRFDPA